MDTLRDILHFIAVFATLGAGVYGLLQPKRLGEFVHLPPSDARGTAEFRIGFGGVFIGLALVALLTLQPIVFDALAGAWLGAAISRAVAYVVDRPPLDQVYIALFVFELLMGIFLIV
jgi:hypothetical protein